MTISCLQNSKSFALLGCILAITLLIMGIFSTEWVFGSKGYRQGLFVYCEGDGTPVPYIVNKPTDSPDGESDSSSSEETTTTTTTTTPKPEEKPSKKSRKKHDVTEKPADSSSSSSSSEQDGKDSKSSSSSEEKEGKKDSSSKESKEDSGEDAEKCHRIDTNFQFYTIVGAYFIIGSLIMTAIGTFWAVLGLKSDDSDPFWKTACFKKATYFLGAAVVLILATVVMYASCFDSLPKKKGRQDWELGWAYYSAWISGLALFFGIIAINCGSEPDPEDFKKQDDEEDEEKGKA